MVPRCPSEAKNSSVGRAQAPSGKDRGSGTKPLVPRCPSELKNSSVGRAKAPSGKDRGPGAKPLVPRCPSEARNSTAGRAQAPSGAKWLRGWDLNPRPPGYEPDELPGCSTPRHGISCFFGTHRERIVPKICITSLVYRGKLTCKSRTGAGSSATRRIF